MLLTNQQVLRCLTYPLSIESTNYIGKYRYIGNRQQRFTYCSVSFEGQMLSCLTHIYISTCKNYIIKHKLKGQLETGTKGAGNYSQTFNIYLYNEKN